MLVPKNGSQNSIHQFFLFACLTIALTACDHSAFPQGHFQGNLLQKETQATHQGLITADISPLQKGATDILVRDAKLSTEVNTIHIVVSKSGSLTLSFDAVLSGPVVLNKIDDCYHSIGAIGATGATGTPTVSFCETSTDFSLEVDQQGGQVYALTASQFDPQGTYQFETPQSYVLKDAIQIGLTKNYNSRIQFEHVMEAKDAAKAAYLNLLPHVNASDVYVNLSPNIASITGVIGDLCPFLLPTRWIAAKDASIESKAEQDAMTLMRLDTAAQIEALAYSYTQDKGVVTLYNYLIGRAQTARKSSWTIESAGTFPQGSTAHLDADISSMNLDLSSYKELLEQDLAAIAQAMGLNNPAGVIDITFDDSADWSAAKPLDAQSLSQIAISRAFELQQIDALVEVAKNQKKVTYFSWLDPYGDSTQDLGFNLSENLAVDADQVAELGIRKQDLETGIVQNLFTTVDQFNSKTGDYSQAVAAVTLSEQRLNTVVAQLTPNSVLNTLDIEGIFQDYIATGIRKESTLASLRIAQSELNRRLLQSYYASVSME